MPKLSPFNMLGICTKHVLRFIRIFCMLNKHTHTGHTCKCLFMHIQYPYTIIHHTYSSLIYTHTPMAHICIPLPPVLTPYTFGHMLAYAY